MHKVHEVQRSKVVAFKEVTFSSANFRKVTVISRTPYELTAIAQRGENVEILLRGNMTKQICDITGHSIYIK